MGFRLRSLTFVINALPAALFCDIRGRLESTLCALIRQAASLLLESTDDFQLALELFALCLT